MGFNTASIPPPPQPPREPQEAVPCRGEGAPSMPQANLGLLAKRIPSQQFSWLESSPGHSCTRGGQSTAQTGSDVTDIRKRSGLFCVCFFSYGPSQESLRQNLSLFS